MASRPPFQVTWKADASCFLISAIRLAVFGVLRYKANIIRMILAVFCSLIGYPDSGSFALAREDLINKVLEAYYATFSTYTLDAVFQ